MKSIPLLVIGGPTASGKTNLSIQFAHKYDGEVVSADSMQVYKGMDIATAKPSVEERDGIKHHLFDILEPGEAFSVNDFVDQAHDIIHGIYNRGKLPIVCGGTGLYIKALVENISFAEFKPDYGFRNELLDYAKINGNEALHARLVDIDPYSAKKIHYNNVLRVVRAIEVYHQSGMTMTELNEKSHNFESPYNTCYIVLDFKNRDFLYDRINKRVDKMLSEGLIEEARTIMNGNLSVTSSQAIGYKELIDYFNNKKILMECIDAIKLNTRHYAKRQITWFSHVEYANKLYVDENSEFDLFHRADDIFRNMGII